MARFEQPAYEVGKGGGFDMNEEVLWVIEKYLQMVREHLSDSIAEDVIGEIRAYLIEAAEDLSEGIITVEAAKKVVAGFGAPSEVAKEYASSLSAEQRSTETLEESLIKSQELQKPIEVIEQEVPEPITNEVGYASTFARIITLTVLWMTISWTSVAILNPWILTTYAMNFPVFHFLILIVSFSIMLWGTKKKSVKLFDRTYPEWSGLQKLLTFPENAPFKPTENARMIDIMMTGFGAGIFTLGWLSVSPNFQHYLFINYVAAPLAILLSLRSVIIIRELGGYDPAHFVRQEYAINAVTLVFLNIAVSWVYYSRPITSSLGPILAWYAFLLGLNLIYQLVVKGQELWWKVQKITVPKEPKPTEEEELDSAKLLEQVKEIGIKSMKLLTLIYLSMPLFGAVLALFARNQIPASYWYSIGISLLFMDVLVWFITIVLASIYYGIRYYQINSRGRKVIYKKRSRRIAVIDILVTGSVLLITIMMMPFLLGFTTIQFIRWLSDYIYHYQFIMATALISFFSLLLFGIGLRFSAAVINLVSSDSTSSMNAIVYSGFIFTLDLTLLFSLYFAASDFFINRFPIHILYGLFAFIFVSFQAVNSRAKLRWMKNEG